MAHATICMSIIVLTLASKVSSVSATKSLDPNKFLVWGSGLTSGFVVPARYFFIQTVTEDGKNYTESLGTDPFQLEFSSHDTPIRAWRQTFDRNDGSYIIRFKLYESIKDMDVRIIYNGKRVGESPYTMKGAIYHDECDCPVDDLSTWYEAMQCPARYDQIDHDLRRWTKRLNMKKVAKEAVKRFSDKGRHSLCHYVVKDNKIYRKTYGEHVGFKMFMDAILLSLTRKVHLPDFELFVNLGDWPLEKKDETDNPLPIFSWCGSDETSDIIMPTYDLTESTLQMMGRVTLDLLSVQGNTGLRWENKSDVAFWRGRDSRQERLDLVRLANKNPYLLDAKLTHMFFFKKEDDLLPLVKTISFFDFFKSKYQINIDGTVAAYRLAYLLGGNSVVLKQDSPYYEHFYHQLKPYEHYIPIKRDLSDLLEKLHWARENDEEAQKIGKQGQEFVQNNLMAGDIFCYHVKLFEKYSKMLKSPPEIVEGMELVEQESGRDTACNCRRGRKAQNKDEL